MLCMVTQTDTTLSTGDHSLPRMEAHIYVIQASGISTASPHPRNKARTCPLEYTCCQGGKRAQMLSQPRESVNARVEDVLDEWGPCIRRLRRIGQQEQI